MSKLVDKERLAKLAQALDARAKAAVKAEETRAMGVEAQLRTDVDAKVAKTDYNAKVAALVAEDERIAGLVTKEAEDRANADSALSERLDAVEGIVGNGSAGNLGSIAQQVNANKTAIETLNGDASKAGSVAKAVADAKKDIEDAQKTINDDIEGRMDTVEAFVAAQPAKDQAQDAKIQALEAKFTGDNSVDAKIAAAQAKAIEEAEKKDAADRTAQASVDSAQDTKIAALEAKFTGDNSVDKKIATAKQEAIDAAAELDATLKSDLQKEIDDDVLVETNRATAKEAELDAAIKAEAQTARAAEKANADEMTKQKDAAQEGTLAYKIAANATAIAQEATDRATAVSAEAQARENADNVLKGRLDVVQGADTVEGSIAKAEKDAKAYADQQITALVNGAPEAMNTLNELAEAIAAHGDVYTAFVETVAGDIATAKQEAITAAATDAKSKDDALKSLLQAEIDADVKVEKERAEKEEQAIRTAFAAADATLKSDLQKEIDADVKVEADRAKAEEADIRADFAAADTALQANIDLKVAKSDYNTKVAALENADTALSNRIKAFEAGGAQDVAAKETRLAAAESDIDALQAFMNGHSHEALQQAIEANAAAIEAEVKANGARDAAIKTAIDKEVEDRNKAIADELKDYSDTAAVKAMLTNVINSLGLAIADNKLQLTLGTNDYVIKEVELDLATDADIDAIIAGLDA